LWHHAVAYEACFNNLAGYRAKEAAETRHMRTSRCKASCAEVDVLEKIEPAILKAAHEASAKPNGLRLESLKLAAEIQQVDVASQEALAHPSPKRWLK
jgi:hypothetical protein